jgi:hypothetical protein
MTNRQILKLAFIKEQQMTKHIPLETIPVTNKDLVGDPELMSFTREFGGKPKQHFDDPTKKRQLIDGIIQREGGFHRAKDIGDGAGLTRAGITQKNHPGVDVANLTEDQIRDIYDTKYLQPILKKYPLASPAVQGKLVDVHTNMGMGGTNRLLRNAGIKDPAATDVPTLITAQKQRYANLVKANPAKNKQYERGWNNRANYNPEQAPYTL